MALQQWHYAANYFAASIELQGGVSGCCNKDKVNFLNKFIVVLYILAMVTIWIVVLVTCPGLYTPDGDSTPYHDWEWSIFFPLNMITLLIWTSLVAVNGMLTMISMCTVYRVVKKFGRSVNLGILITHFVLLFIFSSCLAFYAFIYLFLFQLYILTAMMIFSNVVLQVFLCVMLAITGTGPV